MNAPLAASGTTTLSSAEPDLTTASAPAARAAVVARGLTKTYGSGDAAVHALRDVSVDIAEARFTAVMGPSGSGKSTLMHVLAGLDTADSGEVTVGPARLTGMKDKELTRLRRDYVGFIFQQFNLVPTLTARENLLLPLQLAGRKADPAWFDVVVDAVGLGHRLSHRPSELSGGQQQRVAVARALVSRPQVIFADEPTGNLDSRTGAEVLGLLRACVDDFGQTIVMVTHDPMSAAHADSVIFLDDGQIVSTMARPTADGVLAVMRSISTTHDLPAGA
ncbi:ABC transporter ATP-binding protein [Ornithinimicrobium pekingense]|uniref:ABC transporter ATP-binding protein n=1 Tax=Ornithinimicrobium pekingense TaxID=384677 RepID=A0ABQ2FEL7_9MICO|nr:ABC transporter ATP-binding protein [Ornithinimicrobium pekingense]GGK78134.1 ABC transporter ATP-binding protein [Ornithinimicrobium pekingense]